METIITINTVVECRDQKSAKIILMEAMKGRLLDYLRPIPKTVKTSKDAAEWKRNNWGDSFGLNFQSGWILNKAIIMNLKGGSPSFAYRLLRDCELVESVSLNYQGHGDWVSPDFFGLWIGDQHERFEYADI
jgi:hypothetical protein